ncbi:flagellar hook-associated protein FlgK [Parerythrobacter jejuensis]|uniref:Flagellar hook-associated protein 1 n=1 Tax=Parerythrobacter jejuensis TaxID=795812 RepID=A0A845AR55_9SPHN|nr:flagellar hook-associated protein FlgK [Parerythrobacter jejuensis]MXP30602.1 flagellar hook-associated protein FlgK [Parerythrobacter jejuensis]MXP33362.1 flagellar hook-associated protein FlgK [Parerythrobacter jejuensis]
MPADLMQIGKSGTVAARSALDVTAQNIANANNEDYARRSVSLSEVTATGSVAFYSDSALSGVRVDQVRRMDSLFLQNQARRTGSDVARADAELSGLRNAEASVEQAGIYPAIVEFEASLSALRSDPLDGSLRAAVVENGRTLAETLRIADGALSLAGDQIRFEATSGVEQVNLASAELVRINTAIVRTRPGTSSHATLLDQRDAQLRQLSDTAGIAVSYQPSGVVNVQLGDASGPFLVQGTQAGILATTSNPDGTIAFALDGAPANPASGSLAGQAQALSAQRDIGTALDTLASQLMHQVNDAQASGVALDGSTGQPFFAGTGASDIAVVLPGGNGLATAPAGSPAVSRDTANIDALRSALANGGPASEADRILFELANAVSSRATTRDALGAIAETAQIALSRETAVDLDAEAANLVRYQRAFQASGRVIQVASDIFDTVLGLR